jgi:hypothetical protein
MALGFLCAVFPIDLEVTDMWVVIPAYYNDALLWFGVVQQE